MSSTSSRPSWRALGSMGRPSSRAPWLALARVAWEPMPRHGRAVALLAGGRQLAGQRRARHDRLHRAGRQRDARPLSRSLIAGPGRRQPGRRDDPAHDRGAALGRSGGHRAAHGQGHGALAVGAAGGTWLRGCCRRCLGRSQPALCDRVPGALPCWPGTRPAESSARAVAGCRQPDPARDASVGVVPESTRRALAPWHEFPAGRARDGRGAGRARGPADAHRDRRGPPLGSGAQAPGARA